MAKVCSRLLFLSSICMFIAQAIAQPNFLYQFCLNNDNYTSNSTYKANLNHRLSSLSSNTEIDYGFYNSSYGQNPDKVYALGLCRGDVKPDLLTQLCPNQKETIVWYDYCMLRSSLRNIFGIMENSPFYMSNYHNRLYCQSPPLASSTSSPPQSTNTSGDKGNDGNKSQTVIIVVPIIAFVMLIIISCIYLRVRKPGKKPESEAVDEIESLESLQFDFDAVKVATDNFSDANKHGKVGFGVVYKGKLYNGQDVAVKRLSKNSGQGDLEFKNEVLLVAKLQHRNLVRLLGFCLERNERLLIYEFISNASLHHTSFFDPIKRAHLDWIRHYKIIGGITRGLLYLHEDSWLRIVHHDLKASNIPLDSEVNSKISNFGMAKLFTLDQSEDNTNRIVGTYWDQHEGWAWKNWKQSTASNFVDPTLKAGLKTEIMRCVHIGILCVQENVTNRPTMASVILMLTSFSITLPIPSEPEIFYA
ncbi:hypothetical protein ACJW30_04G036700 [Castanea mollissima]